MRLQGNFEEAIASLDQALACRPAYAEAYNGRGVVLAMLNRLDEATASFRCALAIKPDFALAHSGLGSALMAQGRFGTPSPVSNARSPSTKTVWWRTTTSAPCCCI